MLFSIFIHGDDGAYDRLSEAEQDAILDKHRAVQERLKAEGRYRGSVRLNSPESGKIVTEKQGAPLLLDGPFSESKEHLLGLYLMEADTIEEAIEIAQMLPQGIAQMEVRPVLWSSYDEND